MKVGQEVLSVLDGVSIEGNLLRITQPLDRALYVAVNKVLEAAGGKWMRQKKAHVFDTDPTVVVDRLMTTGHIVDAKTEFQFFESPEAVVSELLRQAELTPGMEVLEPSAGKGAIARAVAKVATVDCIEIQPDLAHQLMDAKFARNVRLADFLTVEPRPVYDRVVMNPPFSLMQDIRHVLHARRFLKPNGFLVSVMSPSFTFRSTKLAESFRHTVEHEGGAYFDLPEGAFKESGTNVRTVVLMLPAASQAGIARVDDKVAVGAG